MFFKKVLTASVLVLFSACTSGKNSTSTTSDTSASVPADAQPAAEGDFKYCGYLSFEPGDDLVEHTVASIRIVFAEKGTTTDPSVAKLAKKYPHHDIIFSFESASHIREFSQHLLDDMKKDGLTVKDKVYNCVEGGAAEKSKFGTTNVVVPEHSHE